MFNLNDFKKVYEQKEAIANIKAEMQRIAQMSKKQKQINTIKNMQADIKECVELGQFLLDHGHDLKGQEYGGSFLKGERENHLLTDGWFHMIGFYKGPNNKIIGIGQEAGGYCGDISLMIDKEGNILNYAEHERCCRAKYYGWWQEAIDDFINGGFEEFKNRLQKYALKSLDDVKPTIK